MRSAWLCFAVLVVAATADDSLGKSTNVATGASVPAAGSAAGGAAASATRAGPQTPAGEQQTRFGPGLVGAVVNAGASLINSALGGGHHAGGFPGQHGGFGNQGGFGQHGSFGHQGFGGIGGRPARPGGFGGFGGRPNRPGGFLPGGRPLVPGGFQGNVHGGVRPGGFQQGGFIGNPLGGFGGNVGGGFGGQKGGACPPVRATCPTRSNIGPTPCNSDFSCPGADKCCPDTCLKSTVCKPPEKFVG